MLAKVNGNHVCITKGMAEPGETGKQFHMQLIPLPTLSFKKKRGWKLSPEANLHERVSHGLLSNWPNVPWHTTVIIYMMGEAF